MVSVFGCETVKLAMAGLFVTAVLVTETGSKVGLSVKTAPSGARTLMGATV